MGTVLVVAPSPSGRRLLLLRGRCRRRDGEVPEGELFVADITEVVITALDETGTKLVIDSWTPTRGLRRGERA